MSVGRGVLTVVVATALAVAAAQPLAAGVDAAAPTLTITPRNVVYGVGQVTLAGRVPGAAAGETVRIMSQACRFTEPTEIGTAVTTTGGAFRYRIQPLLNTAFSVRTDGGASPAVRVRVKPLIALKRVAGGRFRIEVSTTNGMFLNGRRVVIERAARRGWARVAQATLKKASPETAITVISAATVRARVAAGTRLRARLPQSQATCYTAVASSAVRA